MATQPVVSVCFVCLGNICRSPTAEGVMRELLKRQGLQGQVRIDSAGTGAYHAGERADPRSREEARRRGIELTSIARQFEPEDFERFDYVIAMDRQNLGHLQSLGEPKHHAKLHMLRSFDPAAGGDLEVPDPYFGMDGFSQVFDICEAGCRGLLEHLERAHGLERGRG